MAEGAPTMPVFIDKPEGDISGHDIDVIGWVAAAVPQPTIRVTANGRRVRHILRDRPDVRRTLPGLAFVAGVQARLSVYDLDPCEALEVTLAWEADTVSRHCILRPEARQARAADATLWHAARDKCRSALVCPSCGKPTVGDQIAADQVEAAGIVCATCGAAFVQPPGALAPINMIPDRPGETAAGTGMTEIDGVAGHGYGEAVAALVGRVSRDGGWVLDCSAGRRPRRVRHVVNVAAAWDRTADVLASSGALPFADGSFDAAVALAVLDQVRDPFVCARELLRVVRPGGEILAGVAPAQPGLGYANHFYKVDQLGLERLFASRGEVIECGVPGPAGSASFALQRLLRDTLAGLPDAARDSFAAMTIGEAALLDPPADAAAITVRVRRR